MNGSLLDLFLAKECTPFVRELVLAAVNDAAVVRRVFEFNVVNVTIDRLHNVAVLTNVLAPPEAPEERIPLTEFAKSLDRCAGK